MSQTKKLQVIAIFLTVVLTGLAKFSYDSFQKHRTLPEVNEVLGLSDAPLYIPNNYQNLGSPFSTLALPDGSIWFFDQSGYRLVKVNSSGQVVRTVGRFGTGPGEFSGQIDSMTKDTAGNLYLVNSCTVFKLDENGGEIKRWGICDGVTDSIPGSYPRIGFNSVTGKLYISRAHGIHPVTGVSGDQDLGVVDIYTTDGVFSSELTINNQVRNYANNPPTTYRPEMLSIGPDGKIYVYEKLDRISLPDVGSFSGPWPSLDGVIQVYSSNGTFIQEIDASADTPNINGFTVLPDGKMMTSRQSAPFIRVFNSNGSELSTWGEYGTNAWQFIFPMKVTSDGNGSVLITDGQLASIQKFSSAGVFESAVRNNGTVDGKLTYPTAIAYDSTGNAYVLDNGAINPRIQKFTNAGVFVSNVVSFASTDLALDSFNLKIFNDKLYVSDQDKVTIFDLSGNVLDVIGSAGTGDGQFDHARGIGVDSTGNIYVADAYNHRVQKFDSAGNFLTKWGTSGTNDNQFMYPTAIFVSATDEVFVGESADVDGHLGVFDTYEDVNGIAPTTRIKVFNTSGVFDRKFDVADLNHTNEVYDMALDSAGYLEITLAEFDVRIFSLAGALQSTYGKYGTGIEEFSGAKGIALNPITNFMTVTDFGSHRIQLLPSGTRIYNLISSADVLQNGGTTSLVKEYYNPVAPGVSSISSSMYFGNYVVSDFTVNLTQKRDWTNVSVITIPEESKAFVSGLNPSDAPGISATHSLLIPKQVGQTKVRVCPSATQIDQITETCVGGYVLQEGASALSVVTVDGTTYWKVTGLTGTGVMALSTTPTPTVTVSATATPTPTPTATITTTPTIAPTKIPPVTVPVVIVPASVAGVTSPACPVFESFTVSSTIIQNGEKVKISWVTKNTEAVTITPNNLSFQPVGSIELPLTQTTEILVTADNGYCIAKKQVQVSVVATLPWTNTATIGTGILIAEAAIALQQPMLFGNIWLGLLSIFDRKRKRSWGFVYDSATKRPIARAVIRLLDKAGKVVDTVVSEANGTFKLTPKIGTFTIKVNHKQYSFPSKLVVGDTDQGYTGIYLGGEVTVKSLAEGIVVSIPLDAVTLTDADKLKIKSEKTVAQLLSYGSLALLLGGFMYSAYVAIVFPHIYNYIILGLYALLAGIKIVFTFISKRIVGTVRDEKNIPVSGVELGLFEVEFNTLKYRTFTTSTGEYSFVVPDGNYALKVMDKKYQLLVSGKSVESIEFKKSSKLKPVVVIAQSLSVRQSVVS